MTKDRLADLVRGMEHKPDDLKLETNGVLNKQAQTDDNNVRPDDVAVTIEGHDGSMNAFFQEVEEIWEIINEIQANVEEVKRKFTVLLYAPQGDDTATQELEVLMSGDINSSANKVRAKLKAIAQSIDQEETNNNNSANLRIRKIQRFTLSSKFNEVMIEYSLTQYYYKDRFQARILRQLKIKGQEITDEQLEQIMRQEISALFKESILTQEAKQKLDDFEAQQADMKKLENSIKELCDLLNDMYMLLENQGKMVDRIEFHVETALNYVMEGQQQLQSAHKYQMDTRKVSDEKLGLLDIES